MTTDKPLATAEQDRPATVDSILARLAEDEFIRTVNNDVARYHATGDARFVWKVIARYAQANKPLPMDYVHKLAEWGGKLQQISKPADIATALELSGDEKNKVGPKHSAAYTKRWRLASEVQQVHQRPFGPPISIAEAIRIVARNRALPVSVVHGAFYSLQKARERPRKKTRGATASGLPSIVHRCR